MAQTVITNYIEGNKTPVTSATAKVVGTETVIGNLEGAGQVQVDINKAYSAGVFIGIDGHKC